MCHLLVGTGAIVPGNSGPPKLCTGTIRAHPAAPFLAVCFTIVILFVFAATFSHPRFNLLCYLMLRRTACLIRERSACAEPTLARFEGKDGHWTPKSRLMKLVFG